MLEPFREEPTLGELAGQPAGEARVYDLWGLLIALIQRKITAWRER
jgi:hypothetical protein